MEYVSGTSGYPSDAKLAEGIRKFGTIAALARELGYERRLLSAHINRDEARKALVEEAKADHTKSLSDDLDAIVDGAEAPEPGPSEADKLRQELSEAHSELRRLSKAETMEERIVERLVDHIPHARTRYTPPTINAKDGFDEHEMVLLFSDTHAGEVVDPEAVLGMNEYTWDIMLARMQQIQKSVISYQRNRPYPIKKLTIGTLGDMFSGDIHEELQITNDRTIDEAVVDFSNDAAEFYLGFAPYFEEIEVVAVPGNHPRRSQKPQAKLQQANADWLHYNYTASLLRDNAQFTFRHPRSHYADAYVCGKHILFMHGDGIRSTMPGVPWGGVARRVTTLQAQFNKAKMPIDYVCMGHFHTTNAVEGVGVKTFLNGSVKGVDEYSLAKFGSGQDPAQLLLTFHPTHGITDVSYIDLAPRS
jgi:hypothetical protein